MPAESKAQLRFMRAMLAGAKPKGGGKGPGKKVAKEFVDATPGGGKLLPEKVKKGKAKRVAKARMY